MLAILGTSLWWAERLPWAFIGDGGSILSMPWVPLTKTLLHVNALHLCFNLYWLWHFGTRLEQVCGKQTVIAIFVMTAVFSDLAAHAFRENGVGLSGVVYGLFTLFWLAGRNDRRFAGVVSQQIIGLFVIWFFVCIITTTAGLMNVGNIAHGAGAAFGAILAYVVSRKQGRARPWRWAIPATLCLAMFFGADYIPSFALITPTSRAEETLYLAYTLEEEGDREAAISLVKQACQTHPDNDKLWHTLANLYAKQQDWPEAAKAYESAANLRPGNPELWYRLGDCHARNEEQDQAAQAFTRWEILQDEDPTRSNSIREWYLYWASVSEFEGDEAAAEKWEARASQLDDEAKQR